LPRELRESVAAYVGCVAGCSRKEAYEGWLRESGFRGTCVCGVDGTGCVCVWLLIDAGRCCYYRCAK
jgi:hypothetical protein